MFSFLKNLSVNLLLLCLCYLCVPRVLRPNCDQNLSVEIVSQWGKRGHREYRYGVTIGILIFTIILLLTGCAQTDSGCKFLNEQLHYQYVLLDDLPCTFCEKTGEEWIRWQKASKLAEDLQNKMAAREGCYYKNPNF